LLIYSRFPSNAEEEPFSLYTQEEEDLDLVDQDPANHEANASEVVRDGEDWSWDKLVEGLEDEEQPRAVTLTI
jgi:hypothetical protein